MRVAILADIHGNLPACEAVLEDIARVAPDYIVAAGDLALRGAHPRETVELLFDRCHSLIMGNTDATSRATTWAARTASATTGRRSFSRGRATSWARQLHQRSSGQMPFSLRYTPRQGRTLFICHANPRNLEDSLDPTLDDIARAPFLHAPGRGRRAPSGTCTSPTAGAWAACHRRRRSSAGFPRRRPAPCLRRLHVHAQGLARADPPRSIPGAQSHPSHHRAPRARRSSARPQNRRGALPSSCRVDRGGEKAFRATTPSCSPPARPSSPARSRGGGGQWRATADQWSGVRHRGSARRRRNDHSQRACSHGRRLGARLGDSNGWRSIRVSLHRCRRVVALG